MAEYMRRYRARKAAERAELRAQAERHEPETQAMLTQILEAVTALSERVARMEELLTGFNVKDSKSVLSELTESNVKEGKHPSTSSTAEGLAREAQALHAQGLSYEQIAKQWTEEGKPTLKGGSWHKGTVAKMVKRHAEQ